MMGQTRATVKRGIFPAMDVNFVDGAVWWTGGLRIDVDGAPNAYGPHNSGLDWTADAGEDGNWYGVETDTGEKDGAPIVQGPDDPCPGKWVSSTALRDHSKDRKDPTAYVDATKISYLSIPSNEIAGHGLHPGDVGIAHYKRTGRTSAAIVADVGPRNKYGEGSPELARNLGVPDSPRHGGCDDGVVVVVFKGSSRGWPRSNEDVAQQVQDLLQDRPDLQQILTS